MCDNCKTSSTKTFIYEVTTELVCGDEAYKLDKVFHLCTKCFGKMMKPLEKIYVGSGILNDEYYK